MKLYPASITPETIIAEYAPNGKHDGIQVFNEKGRSVGYLTDLKVKYCQAYNTKSTRKKSAKKIAEARSEVIHELAEEMQMFLQSELVTGRVFINETMPNIDVNGERFYVIIGSSLESSLRLNIRHSTFTAEELDDMVVGYTAKSHDKDDAKNAMFGGLCKEDVVSIINQLSDKI